MDGEVAGAIKEYMGDNKIDKKEIFNTDIFTNKRLTNIKLEDIGKNLENIDEFTLYGEEIYRDFYKELVYNKQ